MRRDLVDIDSSIAREDIAAPFPFLLILLTTTGNRLPFIHHESIVPGHSIVRSRRGAQMYSVPREYAYNNGDTEVDYEH